MSGRWLSCRVLVPRNAATDHSIFSPRIVGAPETLIPKPSTPNPDHLKPHPKPPPIQALEDTIKRLPGSVQKASCERRFEAFRNVFPKEFARRHFPEVPRA